MRHKINLIVSKDIFGFYDQSKVNLKKYKEITIFILDNYAFSDYNKINL